MTIPAGQMAQFHLVQQGSCRLRHGTIEHVLAAGDVAVFPHGDGHTLYEGAPERFVEGSEVVRAIQAGTPPFAEGRQVTTRLLCGHFEIDRNYSHPLISGLPDCMLVRGFEQDSPGWSTQLADLLMREQERGLVGSTEIVVRLAEALFIQVLRAHASINDASGYLAALVDPRLRRALDLIHSAVPLSLTLDGIAQKIGMSRSSLAERFKATVGMSPMKYQSVWLLMRARRTLEKTNKPIAIVAEECGYASESAFSRAFKSQLGVPPSTVRRRQLDEALTD